MPLKAEDQEFSRMLSSYERILIGAKRKDLDPILKSIQRFCSEENVHFQELSIEEIWAYSKTRSFCPALRSFLGVEFANASEKRCIFIRDLDKFWPITIVNQEVAWTLWFSLLKGNFFRIIGCCKSLESVNSDLAKAMFQTYHSFESTNSPKRPLILEQSEISLDTRLFRSDLLELVVKIAGETLGFSHQLAELAVKPARGIIFHGPPGTGKTSIAHYLSKQFECSFFSLKISQILHAEVGKSEKSISAIFERALAHQPSILFFDEIDGLFSSINDSDSHSVESLFAGISCQLCYELDNLKEQDRVLLLAATNDLNLVDCSLLINGRFDWPIEILGPPIAQLEDFFQQEISNSAFEASYKQELLQNTHEIVQKHNSPASIVQYLKFIHLEQKK